MSLQYLLFRFRIYPIKGSSLYIRIMLVLMICVIQVAAGGTTAS